MKANRYFKNYIYVSIILSVFLSVGLYATDIVGGMFFSSFWGTLIAFVGVLSVYCDKYINSNRK